ncbi:TetR/AcrR family transcriptional regulator [Rhodococcus opacus]|uniref:TetR/AcrR family transcriptional regulator n=1 Tax=Rhodococcus opacus TaxID=37919 RepID=UPI001FF53568|nr:TetR/AcrR family transcriptional regulator [Rhodococcus opacus]UOT01583.1 TetR/AcrR family transcriptional regulator [Rhodococcus opacus]
MSKSERTRARIQSAAVQLFVEHGYNATTVDQISAAAGVSHMTFFRHFPSKDAVLLEDPCDPVIGAAVARQPRDRSPLGRACSGLAEAWSTVPEAGLGDLRTRLQIVTSHPRLRARMWENTLATQEAIAEGLRASGAQPLEAEVAAGACMGALMAALTDWAANGRGTLGDRIAVALNQLVPGAGMAGGPSAVR